MRKPLSKIKDRKKLKKLRRKLSTRKRVVGTAEVPRVCVNKTNKNVYIQAIDDKTGNTLISVQTYGKNRIDVKPNIEGMKTIGIEIAKKMNEKGLNKAVFDRAGSLYTGGIKELADSMRNNGITI